MYNKEHVIMKIPFYLIWTIYILRIKKYPYIFELQQYRKRFLFLRASWLVLGYIMINAGCNIYLMLEKGSF